MTDTKIAELIAMSGRATQGEWKYGGMMGDPGESLRHFIESPKKMFLMLSESFSVDYSGMERDFEFVSALVNWFRETYIKERA